MKIRTCLAWIWMGILGGSGTSGFGIPPPIQFARYEKELWELDRALYHHLQKRLQLSQHLETLSHGWIETQPRRRQEWIETLSRASPSSTNTRLIRKEYLEKLFDLLYWETAFSLSSSPDHHVY